MSPHLHKLGVTKARPDKHNTIIEVRQALSNRGLEVKGMKDIRMDSTWDRSSLRSHLLGEAFLDPPTEAVSHPIPSGSLFLYPALSSPLPHFHDWDALIHFCVSLVTVCLLKGEGSFRRAGTLSVWFPAASQVPSPGPGT